MTRDLIYGRRAVREALRGRRQVLELWAGERAAETVPWLQEAGVRLQVKPERDLAEAAGSRDHQGSSHGPSRTPTPTATSSLRPTGR